MNGSEKESAAADIRMKIKIFKEISVINYVAEGLERGSDKDFIKFLFHSKSSVGEVRCMLNVAKELNYLPTEKYEK